MILQNNRSKTAEDNGPVDIEAVLSHKHYNLLRSGLATLEIPQGVTMQNRNGSRLIFFDCEDRDVAKILCDGLDVSGINWNEGA
jgi:hypothetical protein